MLSIYERLDNVAMHVMELARRENTDVGDFYTIEAIAKELTEIRKMYNEKEDSINQIIKCSKERGLC